MRGLSEGGEVTDADLTDLAWRHRPRQEDDERKAAVQRRCSRAQCGTLWLSNCLLTLLSFQTLGPSSVYPCKISSLPVKLSA